MKPEPELPSKKFKVTENKSEPIHIYMPEKTAEVHGNKLFPLGNITPEGMKFDTKSPKEPFSEFTPCENITSKEREANIARLNKLISNCSHNVDSSIIKKISRTIGNLLSGDSAEKVLNDQGFIRRKLLRGSGGSNEPYQFEMIVELGSVHLPNIDDLICEITNSSIEGSSFAIQLFGVTIFPEANINFSSDINHTCDDNGLLIIYIELCLELSLYEHALDHEKFIYIVDKATTSTPSIKVGDIRNNLALKNKSKEKLKQLGSKWKTINGHTKVDIKFMLASKSGYSFNSNGFIEVFNAFNLPTTKMPITVDVKYNFTESSEVSFNVPKGVNGLWVYKDDELLHILSLEKI